MAEVRRERVFIRGRVQGVGGYHLAVDALNEGAVERLGRWWILLLRPVKGRG